MKATWPVRDPLGGSQTPHYHLPTSLEIFQIFSFKEAYDTFQRRVWFYKSYTSRSNIVTKWLSIMFWAYIRMPSFDP